MVVRWKARISGAGRLFCGFSAVALVTVAAPAGAQSIPAQVTYSKDIAPILQRSCQRCHHPDSVAPMSLMTYQEVRPYARAIKQRTALRDAPWGRNAMPPWFYEKNIGIQQIKDDVSLSDEELAKIAKWADDGAPEGDPKDLPRALTFDTAEAWTLGKPELIVSSPTFLVPAIGADWSGPLGQTPTGLTEDRYAKSAEYREVSRYTSGKKPPSKGTIGGLYAIHHMNTSIDNSVDEEGNRLESGADGGSNRQNIPNHEVGRNGDIFPQDAGRLIKKGAVVTWNNLHMHSSGVPGSERLTRLDLGFQLHPRGYQPKYNFVNISIARTELDIAPLEGNQREDAYYVAPQALKLQNFEPHMHATGVRMCLQAVYGQAIETLSCSGYDHNWVRNYYYDENSQPLIPKGTILHAISWYDNTAKNQNVVDPRDMATYGNSSVSNMFIVFNQAQPLTDEQYLEEVAKRKEYLATHPDVERIGCPACNFPPAKKSAVAATK